MKSYRFNGEAWYCDDRSIFTRLRQWLIWVGGWEKANGKGWEPIGIYGKWRPWWRRAYLRSPAPTSLFGHRITYYGWGLEVKLRSGHFVIVWNEGHGKRIYISKDGTPSEAHHWFSGIPQDVIAAAEARQREHEKWDKLYEEKQKVQDELVMRTLKGEKPDKEEWKKAYSYDNCGIIGHADDCRNCHPL